MSNQLLEWRCQDLHFSVTGAARKRIPSRSHPMELVPNPSECDRFRSSPKLHHFRHSPRAAVIQETSWLQT
eukprot:4421592-Amphidinium_carterae.2